ncbi:unnamed protein product [Angiostrongylus costaricensis]|uniref:Protein kinase domain-containing protein n=1 Tax=Angiostrongylus costaricensis TaxID=334426 RepID=A0A0R3PW40_ANGCS|nr:unnamed protein product [Angiostrongylus costaricensis]
MHKRGIGLAKWELQHKTATIGELLGEGVFGELKSNCAESELSKAKIKEMMKEARLTRDLKHPNVVFIFGVALLEHPLYIVLEYISGGELDVHLRKQKQTVDEKERPYMTMGAAWGMEYLHRNCILHRDIAARNCLYDNKRPV